MAAADRVEVERNLAVLQVALDEEALATAWRAGEAMTLEGAVAYASESF